MFSLSHKFLFHLQLVTYRETALLIDPKFSSMDSRQRVAIVVAHELAHQWFGNLVVCSLFRR
jgi:aminopeptidase N